MSKNRKKTIIKFMDFEKIVESIESRLKISFEDKKLILSAFVHKSYVNEAKIRIGDNERLEFLGDAVLNLVTAKYLLKNFALDEGELSHLRSSIVDALSCANYMRKLELEEYLLLSRGEKSEKRGRETILADAFEALLGAIFLEKGFEFSDKFLLEHFEEDWKERLGSAEKNFKAQLQNFVQKKFKQLPRYEVKEESGPDHARHFKISVFVEKEEIAVGEGKSKKEAEFEAAKKAFLKLTGGV